MLESAFVPELEHEAMSNLRLKVKTALEATGKDMKRDGGVKLLAGEEREGAENLFEKLGEYGVFVVRNGEIES